MIAVASQSGVCFLGFLDRIKLSELYENFEQLSKKPILKEANNHLEQLEAELDKYFHSDLKSFETELDLVGSDFQLQVWEVLCSIQYGETWSYKELALHEKLNSSSRAVGNANSKNPVAILVPCHRVIGSNGSLTGYAGGVARKKKLLQMELANTPQLNTLF